MESIVLSIDKYDVLRYAETLSEEDLQLLREQLTLIQNVKYPVVLKDELYSQKILKKNKQVRNIPPYKPEPLRSVGGTGSLPLLVPSPPKMVWKDCTCGGWWNRKDCKCGGGRFVLEGEL